LSLLWFFFFFLYLMKWHAVLLRSPRKKKEKLLWLQITQYFYTARVEKCSLDNSSMQFLSPWS
jgi:hypothetical protein